jgi:ABC-type transporter Mla subunit MlaD
MSVGYQNDGSRRDSNLQRGGARTSGPPDLDTLKEDVTEIAGVAVERGRQFIDTARTQATDYVDRRKNDAAQSVTELATSLREATRAFEDRPNIRAFAESAADGLDQLADTIRARSFAEIFDELEMMVRRRPLAVGAASMVAGFLVARIIKSSAEGLRHEYQQRHFPQGSAQARGPSYPM